ncbi:hypothetical protein GBF38_003583, partial [Nibea albiflora]
MASIQIFIFISTLVAAAYSAFITVKCKTKTVGQYSQQILVECDVQATQEEVSTEIKVVNWKKDGDEEPVLHFYKGTYHDGRERFSLAERSWNTKNMNVSLLISNAAIEDEGSYTCTVGTNKGYGSSTISLEVTAKYSTPTVTSTPEKITRLADGVLTCTSEGGYPQGELRWFDVDGQEWTKSADMKAVKTEDGLFRLSSNLTLLRGSIFPKYTCVVYNSSGGKEEEFPFEINIGERQGQEPGKVLNPASKVVAPVVVIGSLIVGLLILLVIRRRRSRREFLFTPR